MKKNFFKAPALDFSVLLGLVGAFLFVGIAIGLYGALGAFLNLPALLIVLGGTLCAVLVGFPLNEAAGALGVIFKMICGVSGKDADAGMAIMRASDIVHSGGLLSLQKNYLKEQKGSPFWSQGLMLLIDGMSGKECDQIMRAQMMSTYAKQMNAAAFLNKMAEIAPAMGLVGTLIGLVQMLSVLSNPSSIGPAMAVALLTTFYGAILAYLICLPLASRLERIANENLQNAELCLIGFKAVDVAQNPRKTQMELNALLPPLKRLRYFEG